MVELKYGVDGLGWWSKKSRHPHGVGCWKSIISGLDQFKSLVNFEVNNGARVYFWHDMWCGDRSFKDQFSELFRMARCKDASVKQVVSWNGDQYHWNISFSRSPNDWEEEKVLDLLALLANISVVQVGEDRMIWPHDAKGDFTIKSFFRVLYKGPAVTDFPADVIWRSKAPTKACFLAWAITKGKVPTEDMLKRRNFNLASKCPMCGHEEETADHLFIHCTGVSGLWHLSCVLLGVDWVQPHTCREVLMAWRRRLKRGWL